MALYMVILWGRGWQGGGGGGDGDGDGDDDDGGGDGDDGDGDGDGGGGGEDDGDGDGDDYDRQGEGVFLYLCVKLVLAVAMLSAQGTIKAGSPPLAVTVVDPEKDKVIRTIPNSVQIVQEADELLQHRGVYIGVRVPEGLIIRIPIPGGRRVATESEAFSIPEMILIKRKKGDEAVIVLFDQRNRPYLYAADKAATGRLLQLLEL